MLKKRLFAVLLALALCAGGVPAALAAQPVQAPEEVSTEAPAETPAETPAEAPAPAPEEVPAEVLEEAPADVPEPISAPAQAEEEPLAPPETVTWDAPEYAAGTSFAAATSINANGTRYQGSFGGGYENYFYKFTLPSSGKIDFYRTSALENMFVYIYDKNQERVDYYCYRAKDEGYAYRTYLTGGTYYLKLTNYSDVTRPQAAAYTFWIDFASANESFPETDGGTNDNIASASRAAFNTTYIGQIGQNDATDVYCLDVQASGEVYVRVRSGMESMTCSLRDASGFQMWTYDWHRDSQTQRLDQDAGFDLNVGKYYFCVGSGRGEYTIRFDYASANESFADTYPDSDGAAAQAHSIALGTPYRGQIAAFDQCDYYAFYLPSAMQIRLQYTAPANVSIKILDNGNNCYSRNKTSDDVLIDLPRAGTYHLVFQNTGYHNYTWRARPSGGCYSFTVNSPALAVRQFVTRLYEVCLDRTPDEAGLDGWTDALISHRNTGSEAACGFIFSDEFKAKNYCNSCYIDHLYSAFMGREPDTEGHAAWMRVLEEEDQSREHVFNGFVGSNEFKAICAQYGIDPGTGTAEPEGVGTVRRGTCAGCGATDGVEDFVVRLYRVCLDRGPDDNAQAWMENLRMHKDTGRTAAEGFIFSDEFKARGFDNETFVQYLYRAFFDRVPKDGEEGIWLTKLNNGGSREDVVPGFTGSDEFAVLCRRYGILAQ